MSLDQERSSNPRLAALGILQAVIVGQASLAEVMPPGVTVEQGSQTSTALVKALVYGTLRHYESLGYRLDQYLSKPFRAKDQDVRIVLLLGLFQLIYLDKPARACVNETVELCRALRKDWASKVVNGVLRQVIRDDADSKVTGAAGTQHRPPGVQYDLPEWLIQQLRKDWPADWQRAVVAANIQAPMTLRVNPLQGSREEYLTLLAAAGMSAEPLNTVPYGIQLSQAYPVDKLPGFDEGRVSVQDEAAQLCAGLFVSALIHRHQPASGRALRLLDACSAPGGKTCAVIEALSGLGYAVDMTALDISRRRLDRVNATFDRLGLTALAAAEPHRLSLRTCAADAAALETWHDSEIFDGILIDAPCSGTGVIRRHPDIKQLRRPDDVALLVGQQTALLTNLADCLTADGVLVYATCSILKAENEQMIADLLATRKELRSVSNQSFLADFAPQADFSQTTASIVTPHGLQLFAAENSHDGFFYSVLHRL